MSKEPCLNRIRGKMVSSGYLLIVLTVATVTASFPMTSLERLERIVKSGFEMERLSRENDIDKVINRINEIKSTLDNTMKGKLNGESDVSDFYVRYINETLENLGTKLIVISNGLQVEKKSLLKVKRSIAELTSLSQGCFQIKNPDQIATISEDVFFEHLKRTVASVLLGLANQIEGLDQKFAVLQKTIEQFPAPANKGKTKASSCVDVLLNGGSKSGVYWIYPSDKQSPVRVYCDQETAGGGWIVFQRRSDMMENFFRSWQDYKSGFGNIEAEFWLGNDLLSQLTSQCCKELRIDMRDSNGASKYATYRNFSIAAESAKYELYISGYSGTVADSLTYHNQMKFSTPDMDNDMDTENSCAAVFESGWWFNECLQSNLNGNRVLWLAWQRKGLKFLETLLFSEMKFR